MQFDKSFQENTTAAVIHGITKLDGVEFDIQISKDQTLWLSHNAKFEKCNDETPKCFPLASDNEIVELDSCKGSGFTFLRLEEIFKYLSENNIKKPINIDVKVWKPCSFSSLNIIKTLNTSADRIIALSRTMSIS